MRRGWILWILVVALLAAATWAVVHHCRTVPLDQCSNVYRYFADHRDIEASFIKDFRLNDTVQLSVTVLHAVTDSAWFALGEEARLFDSTRNINLNRFIMVHTSIDDFTRLGDTAFGTFRYTIVFDPNRTAYYFDLKDRESDYYIIEHFMNQLK